MVRRLCERRPKAPSSYREEGDECCDQPHQGNESAVKEAMAREHSTHVYKLVRLIGGGLALGATGAAILDYPIVAIAVLGLGIGLFVCGAAGAWWNNR